MLTFVQGNLLGTRLETLVQLTLALYYTLAKSFQLIEY